MNDLIHRRDIYDKVCALEKQAIEYLLRTETGTLDWKIWNAILIERTAFKYDVCDCPSICGSVVVREKLPDVVGEEKEDG